MNDDTDLADRLDAAFGDDPAPATVETYLRSGRRALLRRRAATGVGALAVLVAVGGVGLAVTGSTDSGGPGGGDSRVVEPADQGAPAEPGDPSGVVREAADYDPAVQIVGGELHVAADVELVEVTPNPLALAAPDASYGVDWTQGGDSYWEVHYADGDRVGSVGALVTPAMRRQSPTYTEFVTDAVQRYATGSGIGASDPLSSNQLQQLELVELGAGETLTPVGPTAILEQTTELDLPANFAAAGDPAAAALVVHDGYVIFVLARQLEGSAPEYIHYLAGDDTGYGLDTFLTFARAQYDSEEGLR